MNGNLAYKLEPQEEIIGGKVVMMATPTSNHNRVTRNLSNIFGNFLKGHTCEYFSDREALFLEEDMEEYQPDGMVICDQSKVRDKGVFGAPDLVVEVLSPSTAGYDRRHKKEVYEKHGVREYWIVNPADRSVEQHILENGLFVLQVSGLHAGRYEAGREGCSCDGVPLQSVRGPLNPAGGRV